MSKDIIELVEIARSLGITPENIQSPEEAIDKILTAQEAVASEAPKRARKRVIKKDMTDHVYSVNGNDGENLDTKAAKKKAKAASELFSNKTKGENPFPKHRGRKSKAELEYLAKLESETQQQPELQFEEQEAQDIQEQPTIESLQPELEQSTAIIEEPAVVEEDIQDAQLSTGDDIAPYQDEDNYIDEAVISDDDMQYEQAGIIPEAEYAIGSNDDNLESTNLIAQLQERMKAHNEAYRQDSIADEDYEPQYWEGDPGDGTDFIIVEDIPIEDAGAMMNVDIFDNPTSTNIPSSFAAKQAEELNTETYDFSNIIRAIGLLEVMPENYGFLRSSDYNYLSSPDDVFVPLQQIRKYGLKTGDIVECMVCPPTAGDKYFTLCDILKINGRNPQDIRDRVPFEHLVPLFPDQKFNLCGNPRTTNLSTRIVDLFAPIGKGQRALIVAQPKTGKTILMKDIANAIAASHPEAYLMMLLIDERPEEVTDMARTVNAEVIASTFDEPADRHVKIAGLVLEKAKRMVECGHDVVIFLDSITRLARAYNTVAPASGKVLTGGVDANALQKPKRFFGAARNIEDGGSLTIVATALIDTGSKMDEVIFEEFKGTGNMELQLERSIANKRIFPAVNLVASSTRRDDLLQDKNTIDKMWILRKFISDMNPVEAMTEMQQKIGRTHDNEEFLMSMNR